MNKTTKFGISFTFLSIFPIVRIKNIILGVPYLLEFYPQLRGNFRNKIRVIVIETGDRKLVCCGKGYVVEIRSMLPISDQKIHKKLASDMCSVKLIMQSTLNIKSAS
jgi:hypothetical protein